MSFHIRRTLVVGAVMAGIGASASAQSRLDKNVVYGMYSGAALLLDVHYPAKSNGFGVIFISGSGWNAPLGYSATPLKVNVPVKLMRIEGADHGPDFPGARILPTTRPRSSGGSTRTFERVDRILVLNEEN